MSGIGGEFRATKDLDIVVFMRTNPIFLSALADYIKEGIYENQEKATGVSQYYRFAKPLKPEFPKQIELFSKRPEDLLLFDQQHIIPIQKIEVGNQFSGILLEDDYYELIKGNFVTGQYCNFINALAQIPLKARAFNELRERKKQSIQVDESDIKKHRNDILLLSQALPTGAKLKIRGITLAHLNSYLEEIQKIQSEVGLLDFCKNKKLGKISEIIQVLKDVYL